MKLAHRLRDIRTVSPGYAARKLATAVRHPGSFRGGPPITDGLEPAVRTVLKRSSSYTLTGPARLLATLDAVDYAVRKDVPGALVECGVWRGGSVLGMILTLQRHGVNDREIWLYDTFEGMTQPTEHDVSEYHRPAAKIWADAAAKGRKAWDAAFSPDIFGLEHVRTLLAETGYPMDLVHFVVGPIEETIPGAMPDEIAVLRLDTDWYESTLHEMEHLYPRVSSGGVLLIDDYGHWAGARKAVDEYCAAQGEVLLLHRTDYTGRSAIKA